MKNWTLEREILFKCYLTRQSLWPANGKQLFPFISPLGGHCILIIFTYIQTQFHMMWRPFLIQHNVSMLLTGCCGNAQNMQKIQWTSKGEGKTKLILIRCPNDWPKCQHLNSLSFCSIQFFGWRQMLTFCFSILWYQFFLAKYYIWPQTSNKCALAKMSIDINELFQCNHVS